MSTSQTNHVQRGVWTDYTQKFGFQTQLLVTTSKSNLITNLLGILITIACARLFRIALRGLEILGIFEDDPRGPESFAWKNVRAGLDVMLQGAIHLGPSQPVPPARRKESLRYFGIALSLIIIFLAFVVFGVLTGLLATSSIALSNHPSCGLYIPQDLTWPKNVSISIPYESSVQVESGTLAKSCLNSDDPDCGLFINPAFSVTVENSTCPFEEHMCYGQDVSPIRMSTGAVSVRNIGINSPGLLEFNRTTICSPLNMNRTYINLASQQGSKYTFGYYYGHSDGLGLPTASYETIRHGDRGDLPSYQVVAILSDGSPNYPWRPIRDLAPEFGSTTTLIIIVSQKINYLEKSLDPIFPTEDNMTISGDPRTYFINLSGPGTVLGCLDKIEWRDPAFNASWFPNSQMPIKEMYASKNGKALYLLQNSLIASNIFSSINLRQSAALDAQSRIAGFISLPLAKEQWKTEVRQLFNTSLARIMINARDIARGSRSEYFGFKKQPQPKLDICHETYLMQTVGWTNINFTGMLWVLCLSVLVILLAVSATKPTSNGDIEVLPIESVCKWLWAFSRWLAVVTERGWHLAKRKWQNRPPWPSWSIFRQKFSRIFAC